MKTTEKDRIEKLQHLMNKVISFFFSSFIFDNFILLISLIHYVQKINNKKKIYHQLILYL
jgi:hypothetical protein